MQDNTARSVASFCVNFCWGTDMNAKYANWNEIEVEKVTPLLDRQLMVGTDMMIARLILRKGAVVPLHSHHNEQVTYVLEGLLRFQIDGRQIDVRGGEVLCIPPHMPHEAVAIEDTIDIDIFNPPRQDWIDKSDTYLRNAAPAAPETTR
jgi:quercetin dioxygenase-like cupin family protein